MKRAVVYIILSSLISLGFSQNLKVLDLSGGGVKIDNITIKKKDTKFYILCNDSIGIKQVKLNAQEKNALTVKDDSTTLCNKSVKLYTDIKNKKENNDTLRVFAFKYGHNYTINHGNRKWDICVRKEADRQTDLYIKGDSIHIGDSCKTISDTIRLAVNDPIELSTWDKQISLSINGATITDSLYDDINDSCYYCYRKIASGDSITIHVNDTLQVKAGERSYIVILEKTKDANEKNKWLALSLAVLLIVVAGILYATKKWKKKAGPSSHHEPSLEQAQDFKSELNQKLYELLNMLPEKVNGTPKAKLFGKRDDMEMVSKDLNIANAYKNKATHEIINEIRTLIQTQKNAQTESPSPTQTPEQASDSIELADKENTPNADDESNLIKYVRSIIDPLNSNSDEDDTQGERLKPTTIVNILSAIKKSEEEQKKTIEQAKIDKEELRNEKDKQEAEDKAQKAIDDAVQKEKKSHESEITRLNEEKENAKKELQDAQTRLENTKTELANTKTDRDKKNSEILRLKREQTIYTNFLYCVPFAETYGKQIHELIKLGSQIQAEACTLLGRSVSDPYFIMKAVSQYMKLTDGIDMERFLTDVNMVYKAKLVFNDSALAKFKEGDKDIDNIVRSYFFNNYLKKYINALMVLNESMSGLKLLLPEVQAEVAKFDKYRDDILSLTKKLKVSVSYVKVGDMAGANIDLKVDYLNVEIGKPGQILEIKNCIVYQTGSCKPQDKINVTIKA